VKSVTDYSFRDSWQVSELKLKPGTIYKVRAGFDDLQEGNEVEFVGFEDVDNHFGRFVFKDKESRLLEVCGDFCSNQHPSFKKLRNALVSEF